MTKKIPSKNLEGIRRRMDAGLEIMAKSKVLSEKWRRAENKFLAAYEEMPMGKEKRTYWERYCRIGAGNGRVEILNEREMKSLLEYLHYLESGDDKE